MMVKKKTELLGIEEAVLGEEWCKEVAVEEEKLDPNHIRPISKYKPTILYLVKLVCKNKKSGGIKTYLNLKTVHVITILLYYL